MKEIALVVWIMQTGLSVALPPACYIGLAVWLQTSYDLGAWIVWVGVIFGVVGAVNGFRDSLRALERLSAKDKKDPPPPVSFNDHD